VILGLGSALAALVMFLLTGVLLVQHPWLIPPTVLAVWWIGRRCRRAINRW
jgi:hypothetical protein